MTLPHHFEACSRSQKDLHDRFVKAYDETWALQMAHKAQDQKATQRMDFLGEGFHFRAYRIQKTASDPAIVMKLPAETFLNSREGHHWLRVVEQLSSNPLQGPTLIPPYHLCYLDNETPVLFMPYGDQNEVKVAPHWQPLTSWVEHTIQCLNQHGLVLNDVWQIKCQKGTPFVVDLSDLNLQERS